MSAAPRILCCEVVCVKLYRRVIIVAVAVLVVAALIRSAVLMGRSVPSSASHPILPVIILDPGHGGADGGAEANGLMEKNINLEIALAMRDMFTASGFDVVMTREEDVSIHDPGVTGLRKQKVSDLHNRLAIINEHPGAVFISVHQNKFGQKSSHGTQVFFGPQNTESELLATVMQQRFVRDLQPDNHRLQKKASKDLFLLYEAPCAAVLLECGFLSNARDAAMLSDPEYRGKVAFTAYAAVLEYLDLSARDITNEY